MKKEIAEIKEITIGVDNLPECPHCGSKEFYIEDSAPAGFFADAIMENGTLIFTPSEGDFEPEQPDWQIGCAECKKELTFEEGYDIQF